MKIQTIAATLLASLALAATSLATESFEAKVSGQGKSMILIPGLACNGSVWDETVARYESQYECHVLSLAGFAGVDPMPNPDPFLETVKRELIAYISENDLQNPVIVGHSLGGFLALQIGIEKPELASRLVVVDSLPFLPAAMNPAATVEMMKGQAAAQRDRLSQGNTGEASYRMMLQTMVTEPENIERALAMSMRSDGSTVGQAMYELSTTDLREEVSKIQTPTLVLGAWIAYRDYGSTKESTTQIYTSQYAKHPSFQFAMSDHGKHFIMWDDPEFFFEQLDSVL